MYDVYYETSQVCLWYDQAEKLGGGIWVGSLESKDYREAFLKSNQLIIEKELKFWLADNVKLKSISQPDLEWTVQLGPTVMATGLQKMATVVSEDIFNHIGIISLFDRINPILNFENQYFRTEQEGLEWLIPGKAHLAEKKYALSDRLKMLQL
jgi:hypothetical protein